MWWWTLAGVLLVAGLITARPTMGRSALAVLLLWLFFEVSQRQYFLPLDYYKGGGNGPDGFDPALSGIWLLHALVWLMPVLIVNRVIRSVRRWPTVVRSGR